MPSYFSGAGAVLRGNGFYFHATYSNDEESYSIYRRKIVSNPGEYIVKINSTGFNGKELDLELYRSDGCFSSKKLEEEEYDLMMIASLNEYEYLIFQNQLNLLDDIVEDLLGDWYDGKSLYSTHEGML